MKIRLTINKYGWSTRMFSPISVIDSENDINHNDHDLVWTEDDIRSKDHELGLEEHVRSNNRSIKKKTPHEMWMVFFS